MRNIATILITACVLFGCEQEMHSTPNAEGTQGVFRRGELHQVSTREYHVDPPDEIIVKAPNIKELDGQRQKVRPDGKISLNLLDEVYVAGLTPNEINALLKIAGLPDVFEIDDGRGIALFRIFGWTAEADLLRPGHVVEAGLGERGHNGVVAGIGVTPLLGDAEAEDVVELAVGDHFHLDVGIGIVLLSQLLEQGIDFIGR